jgi:hypothetical protein
VAFRNGSCSGVHVGRGELVAELLYAEQQRGDGLVFEVRG